MRIVRTISRLVAVGVVACCLGCGDDEGGGAFDAGIADDASAACESFETEHEQLLNAPTNATVIRKTPTHPPVGDAGLP